MEPPRQAMLIAHVDAVVELPISQPINATGNKGVKLHITVRLFRVFAPLLFASEEEYGENGRLQHHFPIGLTHSQNDTITDVQRFNQALQINIMSTASQFFRVVPL
jgi:hypothetical protein